MRDWLSHRVVSSPDASALVRATDGETWTYAELDTLVSETAGRLIAHGVRQGDHLGVFLPTSVGTVGLIHAAMRIGATFVPFGEEFTTRELTERAQVADVTAIVCSESTVERAVATAEVIDTAAEVPVITVDEPETDHVSGLHDVEPVSSAPYEWSFDDRLCLLFTSGTTGAPKPVELTVGNVYSSAVASAFRLGMDPGDRWLVSLSLHHMGGLAPIYRSVLYGTTVVLREGYDAGGTADDIVRYDVTMVSLVPTMLRRTLDSRGTLADSIRVVLLGGAPVSEALIERCGAYSIPVYPTYGMTESASQIATATLEEALDRPGTVGRPLFGTDVTIVDETGSAVERGTTGEIVVSGPTITPGYYDDSTSNESAFGPHGLHTGDVGRFDTDGFLYVLNRLDDRIITGGENVEPGEVADVLGTHPHVDDVAVVGVPDDVWGERVAALIVVSETHGDAGTGGGTDPIDGTDDGGTDRDGSDVDDPVAGETEPADPASAESPPVDGLTVVGDVLSFARDRLAAFKLPRTMAVADSIPRTVSGTVDREAVRQALLERGFTPRGSGDGFDAAGFEPADPEPSVADTGDGDDATGDTGDGGDASGDRGSDDDGDADADAEDDGDADGNADGTDAVSEHDRNSNGETGETGETDANDEP